MFNDKEIAELQARQSLLDKRVAQLEAAVHTLVDAISAKIGTLPSWSVRNRKGLAPFVDIEDCMRPGNFVRRGVGAQE